MYFNTATRRQCLAEKGLPSSLGRCMITLPHILHEEEEEGMENMGCTVVDEVPIWVYVKLQVPRTTTGSTWTPIQEREVLYLGAQFPLVAV